MKRDSRFAMCLLPAALIISAVLVILSADEKRVPGNGRKSAADNNPDKFHLVATNSIYNYCFTYDPRAADEWLFHAGMRLDTNRP